MMMTPNEFAEAMRAAHEGFHDFLGDDMASRHMHMDNLMCELLTDLGYEEGVKIFEFTCKWYG